GRQAEALDHAKTSLDLYTAAGNPAAQANALTELGWLQALLGYHHQALNCCQQALDLHRGLGNRHGEAAAWASIGYTLHRLGRHPDAITCHQQALTLYCELGDRRHQADTLTKLGDSQHAAGNHQAARNAWQQALTILGSLHHPDATQIQARLSPKAPRRPRLAGGHPPGGEPVQHRAVSTWSISHTLPPNDALSAVAAPWATGLRPVLSHGAAQASSVRAGSRRRRCSRSAREAVRQAPRPWPC